MSLAGSATLPLGSSGQGSTLAPPLELTPASPANATAGDAGDKKKHKKRGLFGFGKKKGKGDEHTAVAADTSASASLAPTSAPSASAARPTSATSTAPALVPPTTPISSTAPQYRPTRLVQTDSSNMSASVTSAASGASGGGAYGYSVMPASPVRSAAALSSSPRVSSPAGSQIFERDVQESSGSVLLMPNSPAIPSHITTENHIPSVLDASSEAITDNHLDPDSVEIITHAHHQSAMLAVAGMGLGNGSSTALTPVGGAGGGMGAWVDDVASSLGDKDDSASNYGSIDTTDVRRLSFISFADVVLAEQQQQQHHQQQQQQQQNQTLSVGGLTSLTSLGTAMNRSTSPLRSPTRSPARSPTATTTTGGLGTSPPTSKSGSIKGLDLSPSRKATLGTASAYSSAMGSPTIAAISTSSSGGGGGAGEIAVETMAQALRRTGSSDLSGVRSLAQSPIDGSLR